KVMIGAKISGELLNKISCDLKNSVETESNESETVHRLDEKHALSMGIKSSERHVRTRLYFTSESHIHSTLNVLRLRGQVEPNLPIPHKSTLAFMRSVP